MEYNLIREVVFICFNRRSNLLIILSNNK